MRPSVPIRAARAVAMVPLFLAAACGGPNGKCPSESRSVNVGGSAQAVTTCVDYMYPMEDESAVQGYCASTFQQGGCSHAGVSGGCRRSVSPRITETTWYPSSLSRTQVQSICTQMATTFVNP